MCFHGKAAHLSWNKSLPLRRDDPAVEWNGWASKAIKQEELQDSETFSGNCYPTAASYLVFFFSEASSSSASPLMLPKTPVILRSQLQDMVMDRKGTGIGVCQRLMLLCPTAVAGQNWV